MELKEGKYKCIVKDYTTGKVSEEIISVVKMSKAEKIKYTKIQESLLEQWRGGKE